jgi:aspartate racemase
MAATHPVLGIIGGMGPDGTLELMRRIVARTPAADDRDHLHMIVESNPKIPSRIAHLVERTGEDPTPEIVRIARNLERAGATVLAMPCNTAHGYADAIRAGVAIPLLDMIALTTAHLARAVPGRRIGLLASTAVYNTRLYERALDASDACIVPPRDQHAVMELIRGVKRGESGTVPRERLHNIAAELAERCDGLLIACTELSVLAEGLSAPVPIIDSLDVLTDAILHRMTGNGD